MLVIEQQRLEAESSIMNASWSSVRR